MYIRHEIGKQTFEITEQIIPPPIKKRTYVIDNTNA